MNRNRNSLIALFSTLAFVATASAQSFDLSWHSIDGGGSFGLGGDYQLAGTIGQPDAGAVLTGGQYSVRGGFLAYVHPTPPACPGDVNGDGLVNLTDLSTLLANFGVAGGASLSTGDLDSDGDVDLSDLAALLASFGVTCF